MKKRQYEIIRNNYNLAAEICLHCPYEECKNSLNCKYFDKKAKELGIYGNVPTFLPEKVL